MIGAKDLVAYSGRPPAVLDSYRQGDKDADWGYCCILLIRSDKERDSADLVAGHGCPGAPALSPRSFLKLRIVDAVAEIKGCGISGVDEEPRAVHIANTYIVWAPGLSPTMKHPGSSLLSA